MNQFFSYLGWYPVLLALCYSVLFGLCEDGAAYEKNRLEEKQRAARKQRGGDGSWKPRYDSLWRRLYVFPLRIVSITSRMSSHGSMVKKLEFYPLNLGSHPAVRSRLLRLFGHIGRADSSQDHSRALYASTTGLPKHWRRRHGQSRQTWLRTIENDLQPLNLGLATTERRARNRTAWQTLVETATSLMMMMMMMMMMISPVWILVAAGRANGQNCSCTSDKFHFTHGTSEPW